MRKILALILALACCLSLFGCKKEKPSASNKTDKETTATKAPATVATEAPTQETATEEPTVSTEVPTGVPTETPTGIPTEVPTGAPTEVPTGAPTEAPTDVPTEVSTQNPIETPTTAATQVPITVPTQTPGTASTQTPVTVPTQASVTVPIQAPVTVPTQAPVTVPIQVPVTVPTQAPATVPILAPTKSPVIIPTRPSIGKPVTVPSTAPAILTTQAPTQAPTTVPTQAATTVPVTVPATVPTQAPTQAPAPTEHTHTFGEWILQALSTCTVPGREDRRCACGYSESRELPLEPHKVNDQNVCRTCLKVTFDDSAALVELGVVTDTWYGAGADANFVWDLKYWNGKVYRAAGDYDKNSGATTIVAFNTATQTWEKTGTAADEAIHGFVEMFGTLVAPGIDAREGWEKGNFYVLQGDGTWQKVRNLKNGVHNFDMIECDGKIFAGLGTETTGKTVAVSEDGGLSFTFVPLYKDGKLMDLSSYKSSRTYEFVKYNNTVYALVRFTMGFGGEWAVFRYEDGKMHYLTNGFKLLGSSTSRKYFSGEFEFNGACYVAGGGLIKVTDFADQENWKTIPMPGGETIVDAIVRDGVIYALANAQNRNPSNHNVESYRAVIYKSTTGEEGSFEEVLSFDHVSKAQSLEWDGEHFYIGTSISVDTTKVGMVLRATPKK